MDVLQHHCCDCQYGGGVDRWHAAVATCLADEIHTQWHDGVHRGVDSSPHSCSEGSARMDLVFNRNGFTTYCPCVTLLQQPSPHSAASTRPGHMAKRAEMVKFDRYPKRQPCPFHPGDHRPPWIQRQEVLLQPLAGRRQSTTCHLRHLVSYLECPPPRHLQKTTRSSRSHVTLDPSFPWPLRPFAFVHFAPVYRATVLAGTPAANLPSSALRRYT